MSVTILPFLLFLLTFLPSYVTALHSYLLSFAKKTQPLVDVPGQQSVAEIEFETLWSEGKVTGWAKLSSGKVNGASGEADGIWCSACTCLIIVYLSRLTLSKVKNITQSKRCMMLI